MVKEIISFIGRAGSGKDYQCNILEQKGYKKLAFADALRDIAFTSLGLIPDKNMPSDYYSSHYEEYKQYNCIRVWDHNGDKYDYNFRDFLQLLGTEGIRKYDNDFWVRCLLKTIKDNNYRKICISDMRFRNEYFMIKDFAKQNDYKFKCIFCDFHSSRYQEKNNHESAQLSNYFVNKGYKDLQELIDDDFNVD